MKVFVSGQLKEKDRIRDVYAQLVDAEIEITHDWTNTDNIGDYATNAREAGVRADLDVRGVLDADAYVLMTDNRHCGKGMYVELGAALALASIKGTLEVCIVGPKNHESIFYYHPLARHFADFDSCLEYLKGIRRQAAGSFRLQPVNAPRPISSGKISASSKARTAPRRRMRRAKGSGDLFR